jgi:CRP-like cAMP-binding protein
MTMPSELTLRHRDFLKTFAIFKNFHPNELLLLAQHLDERRFEKGQAIFEEGDRGESAYFIVFGSVGVLKHLPGGAYEPLAELKSGQMFGQVSLIDGETRSATCVATGRALLLELTKQTLDTMFHDGASFALKFQDYLTRVMIRQVRQANQKLADLVTSARSKKPGKNLDGLFSQMTDAMRSADEMGIDLDEVEFVVFEGQKRRPAQDDDAQPQNSNPSAAPRKSEQSPKPRSPLQTPGYGKRLLAREKVTREIYQFSETQASDAPPVSIQLDDLDFPSLNDDPINSDGTYSIVRRPKP